jgi:hypothetical protein
MVIGRKEGEKSNRVSSECKQYVTTTAAAMYTDLKRKKLFRKRTEDSLSLSLSLAVLQIFLFFLFCKLYLANMCVWRVRGLVKY